MDMEDENPSKESSARDKPSVSMCDGSSVCSEAGMDNNQSSPATETSTVPLNKKNPIKRIKGTIPPKRPPPPGLQKRPMKRMMPFKKPLTNNKSEEKKPFGGGTFQDSSSKSVVPVDAAGVVAAAETKVPPCTGKLPLQQSKTPVNPRPVPKARTGPPGSKRPLKKFVKNAASPVNPRLRPKLNVGSPQSMSTVTEAEDAEAKVTTQTPENVINQSEEKQGNSVGENLTSQGNKNVNMKEKKIGPPRPKLTPVAGPQMKPLNRRVPEKRPSNMNELGQMKMKGVHLQDTSSNEARENSMKGVKNMETCKQENLTTHENNSLNTKKKKVPTATLR